MNNKEDELLYYQENRSSILERRKGHRRANIDVYSQRDKDYYQSNKEEVNERTALYYQNNREIVLVKAKEYRENNPEKITAFQATYYQENKSEIIKQHAQYQKVKSKNDPSFRLRRSISRDINFALKAGGFSKNGKSCLTYIGYTIDELKIHIESQFESWMTWNNQGKYNSKTWDDNNSNTWMWNIDHIIPQSDLPYDSMEHENFKKCWSLDNLRPLNAKQNVLDGVKRIRHKKDV